MIVHINENAEAIVKKLLESGRFPTVDSVVNSIILTDYPKLPASESTRLRLPDPTFDSAESASEVELPRLPFRPLNIRCDSRRVPELLEGS